MKEEQSFIQFCLEQKYFTVKQLQLVTKKQKTLQQSGINKGLLELVIKEFQWNQQQINTLYELYQKHKKEITKAAPLSLKKKGKSLSLVTFDQSNAPGSTEETLFHKDVLLAREIFIRGLASLEEINYCLQRKAMAKEELILGQIMINEHIISVERFVQIKKEADIYEAKDWSNILKKSPGLELKWNGEMPYLELISGIHKIGRYEIVKELGRGGMGVVYMARDPSLGRTVALKTMIAGESEMVRERFLREAQLAAALRHPGIVTVYEAGSDDKILFFTMDYIDGLSLSDYIDISKIELKEGLQIMHKVSNALYFAHCQNVIHRDIKPGNIIIDIAGNPYITDFGLARDISQEKNLTQTGVALGTPAYMSPEQAKGKIDQVNQRSDIYSLGCVFYEVITGRAPFTGASVADVMLAVINQDPISPRKLVKGLPKDIETICLKCLEKDAKRRYATAKELMLDIDHYLKGEPISAKPLGIIYKTTKWVKRNSALSAFLTLCFVSIAYFVYASFLAPGIVTIVTHSWQGKIDAKIQIGEKIFSSNAAVKIASGLHQVIVSYKNFDSIEFPMYVSPGEHLLLEKKLKHKQGTLSVASSPSEIKVICKSTQREYNFAAPVYEYSLDIGEYLVSFSKINYFPQSRTIKIEEGKNLKMNVQLDPMLAWRSEISNRSNISTLIAMDFDMDGETELIYPNSLGNISGYSVKQRQKIWSIPYNYTPAEVPFAFKDIDKDGFLDLLYGHSSEFVVISGKDHKKIFSLPHWWGYSFISCDVNNDTYSDYILFSKYRGISCYDAKSKTKLWQNKFSASYCQPVQLDAHTIAHIKEGEVYKIDIRSGKILGSIYSYQSKETPPNIDLVAINGRPSLLWYDNAKGVFCLDLQSQKLLWQWQKSYPPHTHKTFLANINNDHQKEILLHLDKLYCLDINSGKLLWKFNTNNSSKGLPPCVADMDNDNYKEVVVAVGRNVYVLQGKNGHKIAKFQTPADIKRLVILDTDDDNNVEIILLAGKFIYAIKFKQFSQIKVFSQDHLLSSIPPVALHANSDKIKDLILSNSLGEVYCVDGKNWQKLWTYKNKDKIENMIAAGNLIGGPEHEIVLHSNKQVIALTNQGKLIWKNMDLKETRNSKRPVILDVDNDSQNEIIVSSLEGGNVYCLEGKTGKILWQNSARRIYSHLAIKDIDGDTFPEILVASGIKYGNFSYVFCFDAKTGQRKWHKGGKDWEGKIPLTTDFNTEITIKDINNDGQFEVFVGQSAGYLSCLRGVDGKAIWHRRLPADTIINKLLVEDLDQDGRYEIISTHTDGFVICSSAENGKAKWQKNIGRFSAYRKYVGVMLTPVGHNLSKNIVSTLSPHSLYIQSSKDGNWLGQNNTLGILISPPYISDLNNDQKMDLVAIDTNQKLYCVYDYKEFLRKLTLPPIFSQNPFFDASFAYIARLNKLLARKAYRQLNIELRLYREKIKSHLNLFKFYQGVCRLKDKEYQKAISVLANSKFPNFFSNQFVLMLCYFNNKETSKAKAWMKKLLAISVDEFEANSRKYLHLLRAKTAFNKNLVREVVASQCGLVFLKGLEYAKIKKNKEEQQKLLPLSLKYGNPKTSGYKKRYKNYVEQIVADAKEKTQTVYSIHKSLEIINDALYYLPDDPKLLAWRGYFFMVSKVDPNQGIADFKHSFKLAPKQETIVLKAQAFYEEGYLERAMADFKQAIALAPKDSKGYLGQILVLLTLSKRQQALDYFRKKLPNANKHLFRSLFYVLKGKKKQALEELGKEQSKDMIWFVQEIYKQIQR